MTKTISYSLFCSLFLFALQAFADGDQKKIKIESHPSPNFSARPEGAKIEAIVLHATERSTLEEVIKVFSSTVYKVSSHYTVGKDGRIVQHVREKDMAWHAGDSRMPDGRSGVNRYSIGIELVNRNDGFDGYPLAQRSALRRLVGQLESRYPGIQILTHAQVAWPPGRKSDPRRFKMEWIGKDLSE